MSVLVRKMKGSDIPDWIVMRRQLWSDTSDVVHRKDMGNMISGTTSFAYIALADNDEKAGFAEVSIRDYANGCTRQPVPFLEGIWVSSDHRREGVGRKLIEAITAEMRSQGYSELCSDADDQNFESHRAHENWGFEETARVIYFRKSLTRYWTLPRHRFLHLSPQSSKVKQLGIQQVTWIGIAQGSDHRIFPSRHAAFDIGNHRLHCIALKAIL